MLNGLVFCDLFTTGALITSGDLFFAPVVSRLNCKGTESSISECSIDTTNIESCPSAVAVCQGG